MEFVHEDYKNNDGKVVPSVTTIVGFINKPTLVDWANVMGFKRISTKKFLEDAAWMGSATHFLIEHVNKTNSMISNIKFVNDKPKYKERIMNAFIGFKTWYVKNKAKCLESELRLTSDTFGGTIDSIYEINGKICIVDFKTSNSFHKSMLLQLAGYKILIEELTDYKIDYVGILLLNKKAKGYKFYRCDIEKLEKIYVPAFKALLDAYVKCEGNI